MIWPAFLIGMVGSMHCLGMCGPLALALPVPPGKSRYAGIFLYNSGRVFTYGTLGFLFGSFGSLFVLAGLQQSLSIVGGIFLLGIMVLALLKKSLISNVNFLSKKIFFLKNLLGQYLRKYSFSSLLIIGLLNGLLPCGLVYMAVIGSITTGNALEGSLYMILFGLGTVPAMVLVSVLKNNISSSVRFRMVKALPVLIGIAGLMLILRGMNLGIPYLSPEISSAKLSDSNCCGKIKCH